MERDNDHCVLLLSERGPGAIQQHPTRGQPNYHGKRKQEDTTGRGLQCQVDGVGEKKATPRGRAMADFIAAHDLRILNEAGEPTWRRGPSRSVLDLTLANSRLGKYNIEWEISDDEYLSDHRNITISISGLERTNTNNEPRWKSNEEKLKKHKKS